MREFVQKWDLQASNRATPFMGMIAKKMILQDFVGIRLECYFDHEVDYMHLGWDDVSESKGDLVISGYPRLKTIEIDNYQDIRSLKICDNPRLEEIVTRGSSLEDVFKVEFLSKRR